MTTEKPCAASRKTTPLNGLGAVPPQPPGRWERAGKTNLRLVMLS
jgi:hypothetical protein